MVPVYWRTYGPTNFLYFCDVAVFLTLAAVWTENALLASMAAVGIVLPQILWVVDLTAHLFGLKITGMSDYMLEFEDPDIYPRHLPLSRLASLLPALCRLEGGV
jgi:hypothetical protein